MEPGLQVAKLRKESMSRAIEPIVIFSIGILIGCAVLCSTCLVKMAFFEGDNISAIKIEHGDLRD